jgi:Arc/MetJ family transcription regulator
MKRTTIELDEELLARAKRALGRSGTKETIEEALRRAAEDGEDERARRADRQRSFLRRMNKGLDLDVLRSEEMWR